MPCHRCGARQDDPARGPSPWKRAVSGGAQVLVCPTCQQAAGWEADLDRCPACGGVRLSKTLGVLRCSACGWADETADAPPPKPPAADSGLAADVSAALDRVFRDSGDR